MLMVTEEFALFIFVPFQLLIRRTTLQLVASRSL
jgi:hypothetical protein